MQSRASANTCSANWRALGLVRSPDDSSLSFSTKEDLSSEQFHVRPDQRLLKQTNKSSSVIFLEVFARTRRIAGVVGEIASPAEGQIARQKCATSTEFSHILRVSGKARSMKTLFPAKIGAKSPTWKEDHLAGFLHARSKLTLPFHRRGGSSLGSA